MVLLQRKLYFPKDPGSNIFQGGWGGSNFFQGGVQMLISIETHITCDFPGGPDPLSPLWIRTWLYPYPNPYYNEVSYKGTVLLDY